MLTHFSPMSYFYTPWKRQKTYGDIGLKWVKSAWKYNKVCLLLHLIEIIPPCPLSDDPHGMVCLTVVSTFCTEDCKWEIF